MAFENRRWMSNEQWSMVNKSQLATRQVFKHPTPMWLGAAFCGPLTLETRGKADERRVEGLEVVPFYTGQASRNQSRRPKQVKEQ